MAKTYECPRCNGTGHIKEYGHIRDGVCFKCSGTGKVNRKPATRKAKGPDPRIAAESKRKMDIAKEKYANDPRLTVPTTHDCYYMHAIELAQKDGIWETL